MKGKKILILLPDGVGVRNFVHTSFREIGEKQDSELIYWNNTKLPLQERFKIDEVKIENQKLNPLTTIFTRARKRIELNIFDKKFNETVYNTYNFPQSYIGLSTAVKSILVDFLVMFASNKIGLKWIRKSIKILERNTTRYRYCLNQLQQIKPALIFCTNQRASQAIAPLLAANQLGIPTATFIFSWDNLPKATTLVETDFYFVWSEHMKKELLTYCNYVNEDQILVTGTPQFESHFKKEQLWSREHFFETYVLDKSKKYICFSGDDTTTSPLDQYYLKDLAIAVEELNKKGYKLGIIFRRCPADDSRRYDEVLCEFNETIVSIDPLWESMGSMWNEKLPLPNDFQLLTNIAKHSEMVLNVASTTVFDFAIHNKPCVYFNYEQPQLTKGVRDIGQNYSYIHFRSMPSKDAVIWCHSKEDLKSELESVLKGEQNNVVEAKKWLEVIAGKYLDKASERIWDNLTKITN